MKCILYFIMPHYKIKVVRPGVISCDVSQVHTGCNTVPCKLRNNMTNFHGKFSVLASGYIFFHSVDCVLLSCTFSQLLCKKFNCPCCSLFMVVNSEHLIHLLGIQFHERFIHYSLK